MLRVSALYLAFLDYEKAFDSLEIWIIKKIQINLLSQIFGYLNISDKSINRTSDFPEDVV